MNHTEDHNYIKKHISSELDTDQGERIRSKLKFVARQIEES